MKGGKKAVKNVNRISKYMLFIGLSLLLISFGEIRASVIISEEFTWQFQSVTQHSCKIYKHTLVGPGIVTLRTKMSPFRERNFYAHKEDILLHGLPDIATFLGTSINGDSKAKQDDFIGKQIDRITKYKIDGKKYNAEFKVCNPVKCGLGNCSQYQAVATIIIDYTPSNVSAPSAGTKSVSGKSNILGTWIRTSGGRVIDRMDITVLGEGYKVELREGDNAPIYSAGFGVLQDNQMFIVTRNTSNRTDTGYGLIVLTLNGNKVHYRSYYVDGRVSWDGDFLRR